MLYIFDLDHTVIDSSHRQITRPDGSLDLDAWIENYNHASTIREPYRWLFAYSGQRLPYA